MGLLSFNPGNFSDALAGLSQGLLAYGSGQPQGLLTVPAIVARNRQDRLQNTRQQQLLDMEQQKFGLEKTKLEQEQSQYAAHQAAMDEFIKAHPEYAPYIKTFGDAASAPILKKEFPEPFTPKYQTRPNGRTNEFGYYDQNNQWHTDTTSPMDAPRQPLAPTDLERRALDAGLKPGSPEYQKFMLNGGQPQGGGPFEGTGIDAQSYNIVLTGDPNSAEYVAAYNKLAEPKTTMNQDGTITSFTPDMSWAKKPTFKQPVYPRGGVGMGGTSSALPQPADSSATATGVTSTPVSGGTVTQVQGTLGTPEERSKLRAAEAEARTLVGALNDFKNTAKNAKPIDFVSAFAGGPSAGGANLNASWTNAALLAKGDQLFQLGILNGPDLGIIRNALTDPSTLRGQITSPDAYGAGPDKVIKLIQDRINEKRKSLNLPPIQLDSGGDDYQSRYGLTPKGNQ